MFYNIYTKTRIVNFPVVFKCECCGKYNVVLNPFVIQSSYNDKGTITQKAIRKRELKADESLFEKQKILFDKIEKETNDRNVKNTGYVCVCPKCNAVPKWSKFRNKILDKICDISGYLAFMISLFLFLPIIDGDYSDLHNFLIPIGMVATTHITQCIVYAIKASKVRTLDEIHMPIVCKNKEHLDEILLKIGLNQENPIQLQKEETHNKSHKWYCEGCGKMRSQSPCEYCGNE